ncbi:MAG: phosphatidate cytidylyltransferase [Myxococcota bacterium]|nr:phosphatidate cytidylyltransferase [Myxococcota bacterium]
MRDPVVWPVLGLVLVLLIVATVVSQVLYVRARRKPGGVPDVITNLRLRVHAWWLMVGVMLATAALGSGALFVLYALLSMLALREFLTLSATDHEDHRILTWVFFVLVPLHYVVAATGWYTMFLVLIPVYAFVLIPIHLALRGQTARFLDRSAKIQWAVLVCIYFVSYVPMLELVRIEGAPAGNVRLVIFLVLVSQLSDVLQYVAGKLFGKHPIAPTISPHKTREGLVIGGAGAVLLGTCAWFLTPFGPLGALALAAVVVITGFVGGLVMSAVKRSLGAKDWSQTVPGHGGVLDRLDSLVFSAPIFFHLVVFFADADVGSVRPEWVDAILRAGLSFP